MYFCGVKRCLLLLVCSLLVTDAVAGGPYFCPREGSRLYYERYEVGTGRCLQTTLLDFVSVRPSGTGKTVLYGMTLRKPNGRALFGGRAEMTTGIAANGDVLMDLGNSVKAILHNMFPHARISHEEALAVMPAGMMPGDKLPDAHAEFTVAGLSYSMDITERDVLRTEQVKTPAGTFDCVVVREHKVERGPMHYSNTWSDTWYVVGIGYVRHDTYDKRMRMESSEILVRIDS